MRLTVQKLSDVLSKKYDINCWISDRAGYKSSVVQEFFIEEAKKGRPFALIREKIDETIGASWLSEYVRSLYPNYVFWTEKIDTYISCIKFKTSEGAEREYLLCYSFYLSVAKKYKSNYFDGFEKIQYIVWEECIPNQQIVQDVKYIRARLMGELISIMSIGSTISRGRPIQYIFLGNDIKSNIINPITISFNLLERLSANCEIVDTCEIDDREYSFYFNYFDFPEAVNHWLINSNLNISNDINVKDKKRFNFILTTKFKRYYIYDCDQFLYITDKKNESCEDVIASQDEFFEKYRASHLLEKYPISTALTMLQTFYEVSFSEISSYYGQKWMYDINPVFTQPKRASEHHLLNLYELNKMNYSQIMMLNTFDTLCTMLSLCNSKTLITSNIMIKILISEMTIKLSSYIK